MNDETRKSDADDTTAAKGKSKVTPKGKSEATKKPAVARKKVKAKNNHNSGKEDNENKIIEKLQAMGVMPGKKINAAKNNNPEKGRSVKMLIASVVIVLAAGSFVWVLNKEVIDEQNAFNINDAQSVNHRTPQSYNSYNNNARHPVYNYPSGGNDYNNYEQQQRVQQQRDQQRWMQQQQQRIQQQEWMQQQEQAQRQQRAQQQEWMQQQYAQPQRREQQSYYAYPPYEGYQEQSAPPFYNYAPGYQQPGSYYQR